MQTRPSALGLSVLFEDQSLVVVNKPSGMAVHRGWAQDGPFALQVVRDRVGAHMHLVHRLDRATSGVLMLAKDPHTAATLGAAFAGGDVRKRYLALVRGTAPAEQIVDHPLRPEGSDERVPAVTAIRRLGVSNRDRCSLVEAEPRTGRLHQIRRHLKHLSHPIVGDVRYGKGDINRRFRAEWGLERLALHAHWIELQHPLTGDSLRCTAPVPMDLAVPWRALGLWPA